jgi:hypothetical protein
MNAICVSAASEFFRCSIYSTGAPLCIFSSDASRPSLLPPMLNAFSHTLSATEVCHICIYVSFIACFWFTVQLSHAYTCRADASSRTLYCANELTRAACTSLLCSKNFRTKQVRLLCLRCVGMQAPGMRSSIGTKHTTYVACHNCAQRKHHPRKQDIHMLSFSLVGSPTTFVCCRISCAPLWVP